MSNGDPKPGQMYLYDNMTPPLLDGSYRLNVSTDVKIKGASQDVPGATNYFDVVGPRFMLPPSLVAGVFPPRNGHGTFQENVPHIALGRRTLPWERALDPDGHIKPPKRNQGDPPAPVGPAPWLALLLFEEGEYTLLQGQKLEDIVPQSVFASMGRPQNIVCDAVQTTRDVLAGIMPSIDELTLLAHVRQVNKDDRELSIGSSDGWFSVVMSNRVPAPNSKCCACLVSVEQRWDLIPSDPPPEYHPFILNFGDVIAEPAQPVLPAEPHAEAAIQPAGQIMSANLMQSSLVLNNGTVLIPDLPKFPPFLMPVSLVCLFSWKFECIGPGSFRDLMQGLDVGMFGTVAEPGHPPITDTGHMTISLGDRAGVEETVLYRSPLAPFQLTRDPLGPYHSADQCRRVTPETGAEDVTYACAFEVGRLLAAADARLGQELMRWRREGYHQSVRKDFFSAVAAKIQLVQALDIHSPAVPVVSTSAATSMVSGSGPKADRYNVANLGNVIAFDPVVVQEAWQLSTPEEATAVMGGNPGTMGLEVSVPQATKRAATTLSDVLADTTSLNSLGAARDRLLANATQKVGG